MKVILVKLNINNYFFSNNIFSLERVFIIKLKIIIISPLISVMRPLTQTPNTV